VLRYVRPLVFRSLDTITQQVGLIEEGLNRARTAAVELSEAWIGEDAEAFVAEVESGFLPHATAMIATLFGMRLAFEKAANVIEAADEQGRGIVRELADHYGKI